MTPEDLEAIRLVVRQEIEASKPKFTIQNMEAPRTREQFLREWDFERKQRRRWFR